MIILPLERSFDWNNPPLITSLLVVINCICFFVWQGGENDRLYEAIEYYQDSGLAELEYSAFIHYRETSDYVSTDEMENEHPDIMIRFFEMRANTDFYRALINSEVIKPDSENYVE